MSTQRVAGRDQTRQKPGTVRRLSERLGLVVAYPRVPTGNMCV